MAMDDRAEFAGSHRNSNIIVLGLPSSSVAPIRRHRRASVPGKERQSRIKRMREEDGDSGGLKPFVLGQNQVSMEHEVFVLSQKCLEKEEPLQEEKIDKIEGQRLLRKFSNIGSSECFDMKMQVHGETSPPCQNGTICSSANKHEVAIRENAVEEHPETLRAASACFQTVVSPYFQKEVPIGYEKFDDESRKGDKRNTEDKKRRKTENTHRRKGDKHCLDMENDDMHLEAHRTVSPYFQAKVARDDENREKEKARKEKKKERNKSKRMKDGEPLGVRDEEQDCGSKSDSFSPYFRNKNKAAKNVRSTYKNSEVLSGSLCNRETSEGIGHQDDYNKMHKGQIQEACLSRVMRGKHVKRKGNKKINIEDAVSGSGSLFANGESKVLEGSHRRGTLTRERVSPYFRKTELPKTHDNELCCKRKAKTRFIELEELFSKFCYKGGVDISCKESLNNEKLSGCAVKQAKTLRKASKGLTTSEKKADAYKRTTPDNTWKAPRSPYNLLQEEYSHDPWRVLVICMLLNITTGPQVRGVLGLFFAMCPDPQTTIDMETFEIARVIQSLGLKQKRAAMIQRFSKEYLSDDWTHVTQLHGIGKYAADAYAIFCTGMWDQVKPNDHMLKYYWKFLHKGGLRLSRTVGQPN